MGALRVGLVLRRLLDRDSGIGNPWLAEYRRQRPRILAGRSLGLRLHGYNCEPCFANEVQHPRHFQYYSSLAYALCLLLVPLPSESVFRISLVVSTFRLNFLSANCLDDFDIHMLGNYSF